MTRACATYILAVAVFCSPLLLQGQSEISAFDGYTPGQAMPGGPAGSYGLDKFATYNPASNMITINIPLFTIKGRGSVRLPIAVPLNRNNWTATEVETQPGSYTNVVSTADWDPLGQRLLGAGRMVFRGSGDYCVQNGSGQSWNTALTRATFVAPDGTETEFIDQATGGTPEPGTAGYNRGTVFMADNGSFAKFTSSTAISDPTTCDSFDTPATGTLVFRDGTQYTITDGYVTQIEDRDGNKTSLGANSIVDSMGRTYTSATGTDSTGNYETVQYPDSNGNMQTITIRYASLGDPGMLASGESLQTLLQLWGVFIETESGLDQIYDPNNLISEIDLPDGSKYTFTYHSYGDVAEITLPTGGVIQYKYFIDADWWTYAQARVTLLYRPLTDRSEYLNGSVISRTSMENGCEGEPCTIDRYDGNNNLISRMRETTTSDGTGPTAGTNYNLPQYDQTASVTYYDKDGSTVLASKTVTFTNGSCKVNCSTPQKLVTTLGGMTKETDYSYDQYNNQTDEKDYNWGSGSPGALLREAQTTYNTSLTARNILNLPSQETLLDNAGSTAAQTLFSYDANGNLTQQQQLIAPGQYATTKYTYDGYGDIASITDPDNNATTFAYSASSAPPISITNAKSQTTLIGYNGLDQPTAITDLNGNITTFVYDDPLNRLTEIQYRNGGHAYYSYPSPTETVTQQDQNTPNDAALKSQTLYDGFGRPIENDTFESASQYIATTTQYGPLGLVAVKTNPSRPTESLNYPTQYFYDALGRLKQVKTADGAIATASYSSNQKTVTDQAGNTKTMTYDALGRLTSVADATGTTYYTYNALGKLTKVTQGTQTRTFSYDMLGRLTQAANPESGTVSYAYDAAGNLKSRTDARGVTTTYSYDALNRLIYKSYSDSTPAVTYAYDDGTNGKGHLTGYSNAYSVTGFEFDAMGRIVQSSQITNPSQYVFHYTYNLAGALTTETYPSGRVLTMSRDGADRVGELTGKLGSQQTLYALVNRYAPQGPAEYYTYGNGLVRDQTYNSRMQVVSYYDAIAAQPDYLLFFAYPNWGTTNDNGDLLGETLYEGGPGQLSTLAKFTRNFTYDGANRLTSATDLGGWSRSFKYDQYGNIWVDPNGSSGISTGSMPISNVYDPITNRVVGASYDNAGNQTVVRGDTLTYDADNHMASAYDNVTHNTEYYFYDGMGRRIVKGGPAGRTAYVYDAFGQLAAEYSTVPQDPLCTTCYLSYDLRGDVRMVTDQSGNVVARHDYLPFGTEVPANTAGRGSQWGLTGDVEQKFTGQIRDTETGMDYFHARYYGSASGRFTSPDPANAGANPLDPQSWNAYAYVGNNPLTLTDPNGMATCDLHDMIPGCAAPDPEDHLAYNAYINEMMVHNPFADGLQGYDTFREMSVPTGYTETVTSTVTSEGQSVTVHDTAIYGTVLVSDGGRMSQSTAAGVVAAASAPAKKPSTPGQNPTSTSSSTTPTKNDNTKPVKFCVDLGCTMSVYLPAPPPPRVNWPKFFMYLGCIAGAPPQLMAAASGPPQDSTDSVPETQGPTTYWGPRKPNGRQPLNPSSRPELGEAAANAAGYVNGAMSCSAIVANMK